MFFSDDILVGISTGNNCYTQSNMCAAQYAKFTKITSDEIRAYLGFALLKIATSTRAEKKGFLFHEGPFVKELDNALQGFGVHRQQYFGGAFINDHVHAVLKVKTKYNTVMCVLQSS